MIQIILLTGFLGAGKTTLMQSLLKSYKGHKIGVIVNEFGEINVDARLIEKDGIEMAELSNGSIFCACIKDKFVDSLIAMSGSDLEFLFIEASGLADPANFKQILEGIQTYTKNDYLLRGSICVIDGLHFLELSEVLPALEHQVAYSNGIIVNKADLASEDVIRETLEKIQEINPGVNTYVTSYCKVDIKEVTDNFKVILKPAEATTNTYESRPNSFVLKAEEPLSHDCLLEFLKDLAPSSYRIKGFAYTDRGYFEISAVVKEIKLEKWEGPYMGTEIVVISSVGIKMLSLIVAASQKYFNGKLKL